MTVARHSRLKNILPFAALLLLSLSWLSATLSDSGPSVNQEARKLERYLARQARDFENELKEKIKTQKLLQNTGTLEEFQELAAKDYSYFLYTQDDYRGMRLVFWNKQLLLPPADVLAGGDGEYFRNLANGSYYIIRKTEPDQQSVAIAMILVRSRFFIETDYLPERFAYSRSAHKKIVISAGEKGIPVQGMYGTTLFTISQKNTGALPLNRGLTLLLRFTGILLLLLAIHFTAESICVKKGRWAGIGMLSLQLLALRLLIYLFPPLLNLRQFELFNPVWYGSNMVHRSLGDLLINSVLACWLVLFAWKKTNEGSFKVHTLSVSIRWLAGTGALLLLLLSTFLLASVIRSLVADSRISFDVTNFFSLNIFSVLGFVALATLSFAYFYFSRLLLQFLTAVLQGKVLLLIAATGFAGLLYLTFKKNSAQVLFQLQVLLWLLLYILLQGSREVLWKRFRIAIAGILTWIFIFSVSISAILLSENNKTEWEKRKRMAEKLAVQTDPSSERLMNIAIQYLDNDFLADNFYRFYDSASGHIFRDSIITENYSGYLNKYDTRLYVFDSAGRSLHNEDPEGYEALNTILGVQAKPTAIEGLYYYEASYDKFNYITRRDVIDTSLSRLGTFFIVSNPKIYSREKLFPELFRQFSRNSDPESSPVFSAAVYVNDTLISPPGNYPFATWLQPQEKTLQEFEKRYRGNFEELWYRAGYNKTVVIARKKETFIEAITLFSYIFCAFLFLVALLQMLFILRQMTGTPGFFKKLLHFNIRSQIHSTILFISVFSFFIIGAATISFFISRYNRNNTDKLSRTMKIMVNEMEKKIADHSAFDDEVKLYDSVSIYPLQQLVNEVADIHGVDVNVYDLEGNLQVSSEANVYARGVLGKKINPAAYYHLSRMRQVQHAQKEQIGNFTFLSMYSPVRDENKKIYAYINIPYFTSRPELEQEISNFLVTIINLNAFIFLLAGLIALLITNRITRSFAVISDKMKEVSLGRNNEPIVWNREDEIGELVREYNKMLARVSESAEALAKSEREGAWREMARQVAHEIKNPLTPMKLSIQYLQKAIHNNQDNVKELSASVAGTLVEQIDHLSKIAADFSQFANIGNTHVELFDLHEVIGSLKELYRPDPYVNLLWYPVSERIMVRADKTQMNRLFTNLLTNAVQASPAQETSKIIIDERVEEEDIIISIRDHGSGIADELKDRIFVPNFTTKSSGTGLGLAMCKGITEQAKGQIWFETEQDKGSTFFVRLPLARQES